MDLSPECEGLRQTINILESSGQKSHADSLRGMLSECGSTLDLHPELPPLLIRGWNFASALARWTAAGMPRRTQQQINERLTVCQACPELIDNHCRQCGCACVETNQLMNKLALKTEVCPLGKWS
jgi:hypothetical protein